MWGAIIGDIAGSIYEYKQTKGINKVSCDEIITDKGFFSDDTILTVAVADAIKNDKDYEKYLKLYSEKFKDYKPEIEPYFKTSFSPGFMKWVKGETEGTSAGNGAMMRISPVGYMFNSEKEVIENAELVTKTSHNSIDAIESSKIIALIIYYAKNNWPKEEIIKKLNIELKYKPFERFNLTCKETIDNCLYAVFTSKSFEESIKKVISYGGDTDTNACIVGAMAEALYGIDKSLVEKAKSKIPNEFTKVIEQEYRIKNIEENER